VVVAVVAALFYFGVLSPGKLRQYKCKSLQSEAKSNLKESHERISKFISTEKRVPATYLDMAWEPKATPMRYEYEIRAYPNNGFSVEARATVPELNGDVWTIDENGTLTNNVNGCAVPR
jgi:hypothetical protein